MFFLASVPLFYMHISSQLLEFGRNYIIAVDLAWISLNTPDMPTEWLTVWMQCEYINLFGGKSL